METVRFCTQHWYQPDRIYFFSVERNNIFSVEINYNTVDLHLSGLIGTPKHSDTQKIRITELFFENKLHWQFEVRLLLLTVCTCV
jgi:hypothetical protein